MKQKSKAEGSAEIFFWPRREIVHRRELFRAFFEVETRGNVQELAKTLLT